jgi:hypothetical protein
VELHDRAEALPVSAILEPRTGDIIRIGDMDNPQCVVVLLNAGTGDVRLRISTGPAGTGTMLLDTLLRTADGQEVTARTFEIWPESITGVAHGQDWYMAVRRRADGAWSADVHVTTVAAPVSQATFLGAQ